MRVEFYCDIVPKGPPNYLGRDECGAEWFEDFDDQDAHRFSRAGKLLQGEWAYRSTCPQCSADAEAFVADDPEAP